MAQRLRILHAVELYAPSVGGAQEVVRQISERLAARGHDVTVATTALPERTQPEIEGVRIVGFDVAGNAVRGMTGDLTSYRRFVCDGAFDVVMTYAAQQWTTDALLDILDQIPGRRVLAPCGFSALADPAYAGYFAALRTQLAGFDDLILHTDDYVDARFVREAGFGDRVELVPNGADEREFARLPSRGAFRQRHRVAADSPLALTVGSHTGLKGHSQAMRALRGAPGDGAVLAIVGNTPTGRGCRPRCAVESRASRVLRPGRRVVLANPPRAGVIEAYADADVFLFCSRVECSPLVLFEAVAAGLPFVSVDVGNAREIASWSGGGVVVGSDAEVPAVLGALLADPERRREMGERGRDAWREHFTWDAVTSRYEAIYERARG